jgi:hypothetical protein
VRRASAQAARPVRDAMRELAPDAAFALARMP